MKRPSNRCPDAFRSFLTNSRAPRRARTQRKAVAQALQDLGQDIFKGGTAALILNAWMQERVLVAAALTAMAFGLLAWLLALRAQTGTSDR